MKPKPSDILEVDKAKSGKFALYKKDGHFPIYIFGDDYKEAQNWLNDLDRLDEYKEKLELAKDALLVCKDLLYKYPGDCIKELDHALKQL